MQVKGNVRFQDDGRLKTLVVVPGPPSLRDEAVSSIEGGHEIGTGPHKSDPEEMRVVPEDDSKMPAVPHMYRSAATDDLPLQSRPQGLDHVGIPDVAKARTSSLDAQVVIGPSDGDHDQQAVRDDSAQEKSFKVPGSKDEQPSEIPVGKSLKAQQSPSVSDTDEHELAFGGSVRNKQQAMQQAFDDSASGKHEETKEKGGLDLQPGAQSLPTNNKVLPFGHMRKF